MSLIPDPASFRDPAGRIFTKNKRIFRLISDRGAHNYQLVRDTNFIQKMAGLGKIIETLEVDPVIIDDPALHPNYVVEHPFLPFISYPYEWCFPMLKKAALLHLDLQSQALEGNLMFSDASAYNIQFKGPRPTFIDSLSIQPYQEGQIWEGHRQFCEQFLNPLLLRSLLGVTHNSWYRGNLEGIPSDELCKMLPWYKKLSRNLFLHVALPSRLNNLAKNEKADSLSSLNHNLPKETLTKIFKQLYSWISNLKPLASSNSTWGNYDFIHCYESEEIIKKQNFITHFIQKTKPNTVWDLGCNTGEYSELALGAGASQVIGFDFDQSALEKSFERAEKNNLNFLPLFFDGANPSPEQGWNCQERKSLMNRKNADAVLALAFEHHLAIGRNIPLDQFIDWLVNLAPCGVVEFIPKEDPNLKLMLRLRKDIFDDYNEESFRNILEKKCRIVSSQTISKSKRMLYWFERL
ncbi:MAG: methyltransferase domain-containing protein [Nitrospinae bacterium]|nr:methyltransferase domain-containing protein [Nitrospinota bacterium]MBL7019148.1 methyltransferase domain-containing protein [Nitrospinaceae bacterium]